MQQECPIDICFNLTYDQLKKRLPNVIVGNLGYMFEIAHETQNLKILEHGIRLARQLEIECWDKNSQCLYHYNLANAYSYKKQISQEPNDILFGDESFKQELRHLRLAYNLGYSTNEATLSQIKVNMGNMFSHVGRWPEAYALWREALDLVPNFYMAWGNIGKGLCTYAPLFDNQIDQIIYYVTAKCAIRDALLVINNDEPYRQAFQRLFDEILSFLPEKLKDAESWKSLHLPLPVIECKTETERVFRKWISENGLLLSPLNVIEHATDIGDTILLPAHIQSRELFPGFYLRLFNQIKQEYATARYLIFEGTTREGTHMSDHGNQLVGIDYLSDYSYNVECLKSGFRMLYSIFDKVALFINQYFKVGLSPDEVTFKNLWMKKEKDGKYIIRETISATNNWPLCGIFWVSRDLFAKESDIIDPDSVGISTLRNHIEHKGVSIDVLNGEEREGLQHISRGMLIAKCGKLLTLTRESILNLALAVKLHEMLGKSTEKVVPIVFSITNDERKV